MKEVLYKQLMLSRTNLLVLIVISCIIALTSSHFFATPFMGIFALAALWSSDFNWEEFGLKPHGWVKTIILSVIFSVWLYLLLILVAFPVVVNIIGFADMGRYTNLRGNTPLLIQESAINLFYWGFSIFAFNGYWMKRFAHLYGGDLRAWTSTILIMQAFVVCMTATLGIGVVIVSVIISMALYFIFYRHQDNIPLLILANFFYSFILMLQVYWSIDIILRDWLGG